MDTLIAGSINQAGFVNGLRRKCFNLNRALSELVQNSIDAKADTITFKREEGFTDMIDNG